MNNYFMNAGDLNQSEEKESSSSYFYKPQDLGETKQPGSDYLKPAGDLNHSEEKERPSSYFYKPQDLGETKQPGSSYFNPARDLTTNDRIIDEIGSIITTQEKINEMIKNGYEIEQMEDLGNGLYKCSIYNNTTTKERKII